jgi:homocysteine S-methyltransferase
MNAIAARLRDGGVVIMDGGTGTELERRGVPMNDHAWCAAATDSHPDVLRGVHLDYLQAGADVITANTFASNAQMLAAAGLGDRFDALNAAAVRIAREARDQAAAERPVVIAGSLSHMMPVQPGTDRRDARRIAAPDRARDGFRRQAERLAEAGADLLLLEMMYDPALAPLVVEAARETGLPLWLGLSCRADAQGVPVGFDGDPLTAVIDAVPLDGVQVAGIMHSSVDVTGPALGVLARSWSGPLMAYPDSGRFEMPHWHFVDVISEPAFADRAGDWLSQGVQVIGGCCGLGVSHVEALASRLDQTPVGAAHC